jgi:hypothetical protein
MIMQMVVDTTEVTERILWLLSPFYYGDLGQTLQWFSYFPIGKCFIPHAKVKVVGKEFYFLFHCVPQFNFLLPRERIPVLCV